jgi:predicted house-cleaning noncanonical NTP pyrophosphatase (MazG superfamily)
MAEKYDKLVRDRIPEILDAKNIPYEQRVASPEEYRAELIRKLGEEVGEFAAAGEPEELADVLEVVEALKKLPEYQDVEELRKKKAEDKGAFDRRLIVKGER